VQCELDIKPNTGFNNAKVGLKVHLRVVFSQFYPYRPPSMSYVVSKGLDTEQFRDILESINSE
jgi:hypothetical protein